MPVTRYVNANILVGTGDPEGVTTAALGVIYIRTDVSVGAVFFVKTVDGGNTGWSKLYGSTSAEIQAPSAKIGNVAGGNYTEITSDGTLVQYGTATTHEDLNFSPVRSTNAGTGPDTVTINGVLHKEFTSANNQACGDTQEIYHKAYLNQTLNPHYHCFLKGGESAGTTGATFTLYWELRQTTGITSGSVALAVTSAQLAGNANKIDIYDPTGFAGPAELGAQLSMVIARTAGNAGDVVITTYGCHVESNKLGSATATAE